MIFVLLVLSYYTVQGEIRSVVPILVKLYMKVLLLALRHGDFVNSILCNFVILMTWCF